MTQKDLIKHTHHLKRRKMLGLLGAAILVGCGINFNSDKSKALIDPEHGKTIEIDGKKFRLYVIAGIRFTVPLTVQSEQANPDDWAGFDLDLVWPDIPSGKKPNTQIDSNNRISVLVRETIVEATHDSYQAAMLRGIWDSPDYFVRDDKALGLRIFTHKSATQEQIDNGFFNMAYSLDVRTPHYHEPVVIRGKSINFLYDENIRIFIRMLGWDRAINPDWKMIYIAVVEALNNYRINAHF